MKRIATCPRCDGTGWFLGGRRTIQRQRCNTCNGTGQAGSSHSVIWSGEASQPQELAEEIEAAGSHIKRLPYVEPIEVVTITLSTANRELLVKALRKLDEVQ